MGQRRFQGWSPATPSPGGWPRSRGLEGILRDTSMDGVEHVRQSRPRPGDRRADPVIEMLAVENARLTLSSWLQGVRAVIGHNILIRNVTGSR